MAASANGNPPPPPATTTVIASAAAVSLSPRSPSGIARTASPPWSQVVRGSEPEPVVTPLSPSVNVVAVENPPESGDSNAVVSKKPSPAWNKKPTMMSTQSSVIGEATESGGAAVVMGAELWPSLSECTKVSPKLSSTPDFSKNLPDFGSIPSSMVSGIDVSSTTSVSSSARSPSSTAQKPTTSNSNHHSTSNHGRPLRQKSMKRDGGGNSQANGVLSHQPSQSAGEGSHYHHNHVSPKSNSGTSSEVSSRDNVQNHSHREPGQRNASAEHPHQRNTFRRGNGGPPSRGDGSHQNHGGRRNDDRGNPDWNHQRSFNGRDASMQPPRGAVSRGVMRGNHTSAPFVHPAPVRAPFINPLMDVPFYYIPPGIQLVPPPAPMFFPAMDPELYSEIMKQINYYFSNENLVKDTYLRRKMDGNGWVPVDVIAQFNRVKYLTNDTFHILEAVRPSTVVEVQGDKIRRRDDWKKWVMAPSVQFPNLSGSESSEGPAVSAVGDLLQSVSLDEKKTDLKAHVDDARVQQESTSDSHSTSQTNVDEPSAGGC